MTTTFEGKVALVTGGTSGIGETAAKAYAKAGARVALTGRRADRGQAVVDEIKKSGGEAVFIQTDITDTAQVEAMAAKTVEPFGRLDVAFNNAGLEGVLAPLTEQTDENFDAVFNAVCPAAIETDTYNRFTGDEEENRKYFASLHPIGRVETATEVANLVLWLSSDAAGFRWVRLSVSTAGSRSNKKFFQTSVNFDAIVHAAESSL